MIPGRATTRGGRGDKVNYLHIGNPKTGTTALQAFLARNRNVLAELGLQFPRTLLRGRAHHDSEHQQPGPGAELPVEPHPGVEADEDDDHELQPEPHQRGAGTPGLPSLYGTPGVGEQFVALLRNLPLFPTRRILVDRALLGRIHGSLALLAPHRDPEITRL